ncbi:hypothetical protein GCM10027580_25440 [Corynebacterium faecale]
MERGRDLLVFDRDAVVMMVMLSLGGGPVGQIPGEMPISTMVHRRNPGRTFLGLLGSRVAPRYRARAMGAAVFSITPGRGRGNGGCAGKATGSSESAFVVCATGDVGEGGWVIHSG